MTFGKFCQSKNLQISISYYKWKWLIKYLKFIMCILSNSVSPPVVSCINKNLKRCPLLALYICDPVRCIIITIHNPYCTIIDRCISDNNRCRCNPNIDQLTCNPQDTHAQPNLSKGALCLSHTAEPTPNRYILGNWSHYDRFVSVWCWSYPCD